MAKDKTLNFAPLQLKEISARSLNPQSTLNDQLKKLEKYKDSKDLIVAIYWNRKELLDLRDIIMPKVNLKELWIFGPKDIGKGFLYGDLKGCPKYKEFNYPG